MSRLIVHVEGQTEESFVNQVLAPHLYDHGYTSVSARLIGNARQRSRRGGIRRWELVRDGILSHLKADDGLSVTTMVDYYGLPTTWPGRAEAPALPFPDRSASVERDILDDVSAQLGDSFDRQRFIPYVVMHEFEGLLFSDPEGLGRGIGQDDLTPNFLAIRNAFDTPEQINDSPETAPSTRVLGLFPRYQKPLQGTLAAQEIGLEAIRRECPQFSRWIERLEERAR